MADLPATLDLKDLAYELAVNFFPLEVVCLRHSITKAQIDELKGDPEFRRILLDEQKATAVSGEAFRLKAAGHAFKTLEHFAKMAVDEEVPYAQRLKAGELVAQWAGGGYGGAAQAASGMGMQIVLQTNLALNPMQLTGGEYEAKAITIDNDEDLLG